MNGDVTCLEDWREDCEGEVGYYVNPHNEWKAFPRCEKHHEAAVKAAAAIAERYPDTPNPPEWFDPSYAGEHWDSDY
jgi:hypothetical protein|tara:strand:- start:4451 stop:4681 length:231 start_codon:yes stop_codon:yes gene_type:complete